MCSQLNHLLILDKFVHFCVDFLFEAWRPLVGDESFLFVQGVAAFKRRDYLDYNVTAASRQHYAKTFRSVSQTAFVYDLQDWHITRGYMRVH